MKTEEDKLCTFQGWPVYKMTLEEILPKLGFEETSHMGHKYWQIRDDNPLLKAYPIIYHDDGMGYSPTTEYVYDVYIYTNESDDSLVVLWADQKEKEE